MADFIDADGQKEQENAASNEVIVADIGEEAVEYAPVAKLAKQLEEACVCSQIALEEMQGLCVRAVHERSLTHAIRRKERTLFETTLELKGFSVPTDIHLAVDKSFEAKEKRWGEALRQIQMRIIGLTTLLPSIITNAAGLCVKTTGFTALERKNAEEVEKEESPFMEKCPRCFAKYLGQSPAALEYRKIKAEEERLRKEAEELAAKEGLDQDAAQKKIAQKEETIEIPVSEMERIVALCDNHRVVRKTLQDRTQEIYQLKLQIKECHDVLKQRDAILEQQRNLIFQHQAELARLEEERLALLEERERTAISFTKVSNRVAAAKANSHRRPSPYRTNPHSPYRQQWSTPTPPHTAGEGEKEEIIPEAMDSFARLHLSKGEHHRRATAVGGSNRADHILRTEHERTTNGNGGNSSSRKTRSGFDEEAAYKQSREEANRLLSQAFDEEYQLDAVDQFGDEIIGTGLLAGLNDDSTTGVDADSDSVPSGSASLLAAAAAGGGRDPMTMMDSSSAKKQQQQQDQQQQQGGHHHSSTKKKHQKPFHPANLLEVTPAMKDEILGFAQRVSKEGTTEEAAVAPHPDQKEAVSYVFHQSPAGVLPNPSSSNSTKRQTSPPRQANLLRTVNSAEEMPVGSEAQIVGAATTKKKTVLGASSPSPVTPKKTVTVTPKQQTVASSPLTISSSQKPLGSTVRSSVSRIDNLYADLL